MPKCNAAIRAGKVCCLPVSIIQPNPDQPRRHFDEEALRELTESVRRYGIIQPLTVRKEEGEYILIAGERRLRAARLAGHKTVPCIISTASAALSPILALIENIQRQELNFFEEAEGFLRLTTECGMTQEQAAEAIGISQPAVANKLRLLRLSPELQELLLSGGLTERHARALLRIEEEADRKFLLCEMLRRSLTVADSEKMVADFLESKQKAEDSPKKRMPRLFKDVRIFVNTINHAVSVMRESGIDAVTQTQESDDYIEYHIRIPKGATLTKKTKKAG